MYGAQPKHNEPLKVFYNDKSVDLCQHYDLFLAVSELGWKYTPNCELQYMSSDRIMNLQ